MGPEDIEEGARWLEQAEDDLEMARTAAGAGKFNFACFHAQQAAEKALKAYLYASGHERPLGHSVEKLCEEAAAFDAAFSALALEVKFLDLLYLPTRYPNALPGSTPSRFFKEHDAQAALDASAKVLQLVRQRRFSAP